MSVSEGPIPGVPDESALVAALRAGNEEAFATLVDLHTAPMRRLALTFVRSGAVADEVVQEAWLGVLKGIDRFEGRSSLKTWIFRILTNAAKTRAQREARSVPFSSLEGELADDERSVDPDRFLGADHRLAGHWASPPETWRDVPEARLISAETRSVIERAMEGLPPTQRLVIALRDVEGWASDEVCDALELSEGNQRVLLHRARSKVRAALEEYVRQDAA
jgi:RNA polymerase sigma-70 factor (ECF subfamily)